MTSIAFACVHRAAEGTLPARSASFLRTQSMARSRNWLRAQEKKSNLPDKITVHVEYLENAAPSLLSALDVITLNVTEPKIGRSAAKRLLRFLGVSNRAIDCVIKAIINGAAPSGANMRGAMIVDATTGQRLEPDQERGVRASRFDWTDDACDAVKLVLSKNGLAHFRTREALALATKVVHAPGAIAELCWSDDPDYTAGYVASHKTGYVRFPVLKQTGDERGGRAIFVDRTRLNIDTMLQYLKNEVVLISAVGSCGGPATIEDYFDKIETRR